MFLNKVLAQLADDIEVSKTEALRGVDGGAESGVESMEGLFTALSSAEAVSIQNIYDYTTENLDKLKGIENGIEQFYPNVAPSWPNAFWEFKDRQFGSVGVHVRSRRVEDFAPEEIGDADDWKWVSDACFWLRKKGVSLPPIPTQLTVAWRIQSDGQLWWEPSLYESGERIDWDIEGNKVHWGILLYMHNVWTAQCFIHCKNTKTVERRLSHVVGAKKFVRAGQKPKHTYHVLDIEPMKAVLSKEGNVKKNGTAKAMHICRGHFADYREKGLFGKHKGIFWFDQHVRGDRKHGVVEKDYRTKGSVTA